VLASLRVVAGWAELKEESFVSTVLSKGGSGVCAALAFALLGLGVAESCAAAQYKVELLNALSGSAVPSIVRAVNDAGAVAGDSPKTLDGSKFPAVRWEAGGSAPTELDSGIYANGAGWDISGRGDVSGFLVTKTFSFNLVSAARWDAGGTTATLLPSLNASLMSPSMARSINERGEMAGVSGYAVRWSADGRTVTRLPSFKTGNAATDAFGINNAGDVVGSSSDSSTAGATLWFADQNTPVALPNLSDTTLTSKNSVAYAINDSRQIAGTIKLYSGFDLVDTRSVRWAAGGAGVTDLGSGSASSINGAGDVVGRSAAGAMLWAGDGTAGVNLNDLIAPDSGWVLRDASDISDTGIIVGSGLYDPDGAGPRVASNALYRLVPLPEPGAVSIVVLASLMALRGRHPAKRPWRGK
jgi:hypothetical protein